MVPLITWAVFSYAAGLLAGTAVALVVPALLACGAIVAASIVGALAAPSALQRRRFVAPVSCAILAATGILMACAVRARDEGCVAHAWTTQQWRTVRSRTPCAAAEPVDSAHTTALQRWRTQSGARIDSLFGGDAPLVRALLIADAHDISPDMRDRFAAAGMMHMLSISGLHVAIIAGAVLLALEALRVPRTRARWGALLVTAWYVAAIGAPPPALRSAAMLGVVTASRSLGRPVSPWATLALAALVPLVDPHNVTNVGWQLSVAGYAAVIAAGVFVRRELPHDVRGWRRVAARDVAVSILAGIVTAPLVAWTFGRLSLIGPATNLLAAPVIGVLQPTLFLTLLLAPFHSIAIALAGSAHPLLLLLDGIARAGASVPYGSLQAAPSLAVTLACVAAAAALLVAVVSRDAAPALIAGGAAAGAAIWMGCAPLSLPGGSGSAELHLIDVGQGDAVAVRTPHGSWILVDAGRTWAGGDAGRSTVIPYLRSFGGALTLFVLTHPHADHVGGAASVLRALHPAAYRDAAFAGGSESYRASLTTAAALGIPWARVHPGDSLAIDGVGIVFLAPDSAWTAHLRDPNLASTVMLVQYGAVRFLLTGDAESPEEAWLVAHEASALHADVLKVGHHGSNTSSSAAFLDAVQPRVALVSVGAGNSYGHPSESVMRDLSARGTTVLRTDELGTIVVRTDGRTLVISGAGRSWAVP